MTTAPAPPRSTGTAAPPRVRLVPVAAVATAGVVVAVLLAAVHLAQGTADVNAGQVLAALLGRGDDQQVAVLVASRLPRLAAGALVGVALGVAGAIFQSVARNPLASPDTMAVNAGAFLAVTAIAVTGLTIPLALRGGVAFAGGLAGAALVMALARGGASGPTRLILAGATTGLALSAVTTVMLVLFQQETVGLYAWGAGSVVQSGTAMVAGTWPAVAVGVLAALVLARRLDLLALGDDVASVLGVAVARTRVVAVVVAVLLSAAAVTLAGPIGFVGLCAPVLVRLLARRVSGLQRHVVLLPLAGLAGVLVVLAADVLLRAVLGGDGGVRTPTGLVTSLVGATVLVLLARRMSDSGPTRRVGTAGAGRPRTGRAVAVLAGALTLLAAGALLAGALLGDRMLLTGDLLHWLAGESGRVVTASVDERLPRVLAAATAGAALAVAGTVVQAVSRNPLAEPGLLGITAGAGVGAVGVLSLVPSAGIWLVAAAAGAGALATFAFVYGLSWRGGLSSERLVLIGVGTGAGASAVTAGIVLATNPYNLTYALTWLSGTTYGRTWSHLLPLLVVGVVATPVLVLLRHRLDLLAVDDDTPRVLGVPLERTRLVLLVGAALLTAAAVCAVGVVGFVGLVAPHAARALVGGRSAHVLGVAALLGAVLVSVADTIGRTVIAPAQFPAGLVTALIGAPYFLYLLWRTRRSEIS